jgi:cytoskeleton protein RodZ
VETATTTPAAAAAASAGGDAIVLTFKDYSWTEIRDRDGRVILSGMNRGGTTQNVSGTPPLDVVIGNASDVRVAYRGNPVDLVPHTRQNVARFKLP